jgi:NTE family protein
MLHSLRRHVFKKRQKTVGLALGSGGAKGLAHIGVIKVFERNNIPIDYIAGTSIGSLIGGAYSKERDISKIEQTIRSSRHRDLIRLFFDPTMGAGIIKGKAIEDFLSEQIGPSELGHLEIPFKAVATDIKSGDAYILERGDLVEAIRASISVPLLFQPTKVDGRYLIDGAVSDPVPVDVVKQMGADITIAVNLNDDSYVDRSKKLTSISMATAAIYFFNYNLSREKIKEADVVITPRIHNASWTRFANGIEIIQAGEEAALKALPEIKKLLSR